MASDCNNNPLQRLFQIYHNPRANPAQGLEVNAPA